MAEAKRRVGRRRTRADRTTVPSDSAAKKKKVDTSKQKKERLKELAVQIDRHNVDIEQRAKARSAMQDEAFEIMQELGIKSFDVPRVGTHEVEQKKGNASNTIDTRKFMAAVSEEDFHSSINVVKARAEEVMPKKTLEKITTTVPGKLKDPTYKFTPAGTKK